MSKCDVCGENLSMRWAPLERDSSGEQDFEDYSDLEHNHRSGLIMSMIPTPLINGQDVSPKPFEKWAEEAMDDNPQMADLNLRFAANRGSWWAMMALAESRNELGMDHEAYRWASRVVFLLEDDRNPFLKRGLFSNKKKVVQDAKEFMAKSLRNLGVNSLPTPNDVGAGSILNKYCLEHGALVSQSARIGYCDESLHLTNRSFG